MEDQVAGILEYLLANPVFLAPILLMAAVVIYGIVKKLLKMAFIVAIAGGLYVMLVQNFGPGL
jgi:hypothetical protein